MGNKLEGKIQLITNFKLLKELQIKNPILVKTSVWFPA